MLTYNPNGSNKKDKFICVQVFIEIFLKFFRMNGRVSSTKAEQRCKLKVIQAYAPTSTYNDAEVDQLYEDSQSIMNRRPAHYNEIIGNFNVKVGDR